VASYVGLLGGFRDIRRLRVQSVDRVLVALGGMAMPALPKALLRAGHKRMVGGLAQPIR